MNKGNKIHNKIVSVLFLLMLSVSIFSVPFSVSAQADRTADPSSPDFKLVSCDGPDLRSQPKLLADAEAKLKRSYVPCDFGGAMGQVQHLINIAIALGVLAALVLFSYGGYLYVEAGISGKAENKNKAKTIFQKVIVGFIIMLVAWFIVYQLIAWLSSNSSAATTLLK